MGIRRHLNFSLFHDKHSKPLLDESLLLSNPQHIWDYADANGYIRDSGGLWLKRFIEEKLKIKIIEKDLDQISGAITKNSTGEWVILINSNNTVERRNFTLGHELGHYFLHREPFVDEETQIFYRQEVHDDKEYAADRFAVELLMPAAEVEKIVDGGITSIPELAKKFGVSPKAMFFRLKELGYTVEE